MNRFSRKGLAYFAWCWATIGFLGALSAAIWNLLPHAVSAIDFGLSPIQWGLLILNVFAMAYYEGFKGFQRGFSPRFAARARSLLDNPTLIRTILAPVYCMGFFAAPKRRIFSAFALTLMIIIFVIIFRQLPQPWRGIFDWGVIVGLTWGCIATAYSLIVASYLESSGES